MAGEEGDLAAFESAANVGLRRSSERSLQPNFFDFGEAGHGIEPTASDDSDFHLWQTPSSV